MPSWTGGPAGDRPLIRSTLAQCALAVALVGAGVLVRLALEPWLQGQIPFLTFFLPLLLVAWFCGIGATVLALALSVVAVELLVLPGELAFDHREPASVIALVGFLLVAGTMVGLSRWASRARTRAERGLDLARRSQRATRMAVWDYDARTGELHSEELPRLFGIPGPADREALRALVHPEDLPASIERLEESVRTGRPLRGEVRIQHPTLGERWFSIRADAQRDEAGEVVRLAGVTQDVTDRRESEEARALLAAIVESSTDAIVSKDRRGVVRSWNAGAERLFGWTAEEMVGRSIEQVIPLERRFEETDILARIHRGERIENFETERVTKDGRRIDVSLTISPVRDAQGRIAGASKIARDVTLRRQAEREIVEQREWLRVTLASIGDAVIATDERGAVAFLNPVAEQLTGWKADEAIGRPCSEVFHIVNERTRERVESPVVRVLQDGVVVGLANHTVLVARDGVERPIDDSGAPIRGADDRIAGAVLVFRDVTERRQADEERAAAAAEREHLLESERHARTEAERANRLKDEFVATLSHELRTPLNAIVGWTQLLRAQKPDEETLERGLEVVQRNARIQAQLVSDLLDMSRIVSGKMRLELQTVDLGEIVRETCDSLRSAADGKRIRLDCDLESGLAPIVGDPARLQQITWNLITNAIKFTPREGRVDVRVRRAGTQVELVVEDDGAGIPEELLPVLFQRFRQGDGALSRRVGGLGLGLAIVRQLVELHGGEVWAESPGPDRGSSFTVQIPLAEARLRSGDEEPLLAAGDETERELELLRGLDVLVVEDERDTLELVQRLLGEAGSAVRTATDAEEALAAWAEAPPDLLISDIGLPGMDGYELLRRLRDGQPALRVPAIALTAFARPVDRRRALAAGYQSHVVKPVEPEELLATVASLARLVRGQEPPPS